MLSECVRCVGSAVCACVCATSSTSHTQPQQIHSTRGPHPRQHPRTKSCTTTHECAEGKLVCASRRASCGNRVGGWPSLRWRSHVTQREMEGGRRCVLDVTKAVSTNAAATTTHVAHVWSGPIAIDTPVQRSDRQLIDRRELRALGPQPSLYAPLLGHGANAARPTTFTQWH
jgi:hypothetical protein